MPSTTHSTRYSTTHSSTYSKSMQRQETGDRRQVLTQDPLTQHGRLRPVLKLLAQPIQSPMRSQPHDRCQLTNRGGRHG